MTSKTNLRKDLAARRVVAAKADPKAGARLAEIFLKEGPEVAEGMVVAGIWPIRTEIDIRVLMDQLAVAGVHLALPHAPDREGRLDFRQYDGGRPPAMDAWGIPSPSKDASILLPDLVLVPLLGFDRRGGRLGYGAGLYDRAIARLKAQKRRVVTVGVGFADQEVDAVPREDHDVLLDWVITEDGVAVRPNSL